MPLFSKDFKYAAPRILTLLSFPAAFLFGDQIKELTSEKVGFALQGAPWIIGIVFTILGFVGGIFANDPWEDGKTRFLWSLGFYALPNLVFTLPDVKNTLPLSVWLLLWLLMPLLHWQLKKNPKSMIVPVLVTWTGVNLWVASVFVMEADGLANLKFGVWTFWGVGTAWLGFTMRQLSIAFAAIAASKKAIRPRGPVSPMGGSSFGYDDDEMGGGDVRTEDW